MPKGQNGALLVRMFQRGMKTTPAKYVEEVRLEAVCQALELGGRSLESIARRYGYQSVDVLRRAFVRRLGVTPKEYAQRFAIAALDLTESKSVRVVGASVLRIAQDVRPVNLERIGKPRR